MEAHRAKVTTASVVFALLAALSSAAFAAPRRSNPDFLPCRQQRELGDLILSVGIRQCDWTLRQPRAAD